MDVQSNHVHMKKILMDANNVYANCHRFENKRFNGHDETEYPSYYFKIR